MEPITLIIPTGPDVSFYQADLDAIPPRYIDFLKMKEAGASFVLIRVGQNTWKDRDIQYNWKAAKQAGLPRGCYWFYDSRADPKKQAALCISLLNGDYGELPIFADFEDIYNGPFHGWKHWFDFLEELKKLAPGKEIGIYTNYYYWTENTVSVNIPTASLDYFKQYPLWVANYKTDSPLIPKPWSEYIFWQFTDAGDGEMYGVQSKEIDLDYFNGSMADFLQRFALPATQEPQPQEPKEEPMTQPIEIKTKVNTRLRPGATTDNTPITTIPANTTLTGSKWIIIPADVYKNGTLIQRAGDKWLEVVTPQPGYMAVIHMGSSADLPAIIRDDTVTQPEPPPSEPPADDPIVKVIIYHASGTTETLPVTE